MIIKKICNIILSILITITLNPIIYAEDLNDDTDKKDTNLSYRVNDSYSWSVPSKIEFTEDDYLDVSAIGNDSKIKIFDNIIPAGKKLQISLDDSNSFKLRNSLNNSLNYEVFINGVRKNAGESILNATYKMDYSEATLSATLVLDGTETASDYSDTLLFVADIVDDIYIPTKGDLIEIDNNTYRLLKDKGSDKWLVMSMSLLGPMDYNDSISYTTFFGDTEGIKYEGSTVDLYLENDYYNTLSFKDAIIPEDIYQDIYMYESTNPTGNYYTAWYKNEFSSSDNEGITYYLLDNYEQVHVGSRNVFLLSIKDLDEYLDCSIFTPQLLNKMFYNAESSTDITNGIWLRSSYLLKDKAPIFVTGYASNTGQFIPGNCNADRKISPSFVLDLSKVEYSPIYD